MKLVRYLAVAAALAAGLVVLRSPRADAASAPGVVTFLRGEAVRVGANGRSEPLKVDGRVFEGDTVETRARTRLEIKLPDESIVRVGPDSKVQLASAVFGKSAEDRKVTAKLVVGNVWAKVAHAVGGDAKFEVQTDTAVAGVRGTTFRVDAAHDKSVVVRTYAGAVAVASGPIPRPEHKSALGGKKEHKQIAPPFQQVTRKQWEKLVGAMMQVKVAADGTPGEPEQFALDQHDEWEEWNRARDAAADKAKGG